MICLAQVIAALDSCSAQNETISQGAHKLVFTDEEDVSVPITVRWASWNGHIKTKEFTVYAGGRVALKTEPCLSYDI